MPGRIVGIGRSSGKNCSAIVTTASGVISIPDSSRTITVNSSSRNAGVYTLRDPGIRKKYAARAASATAKGRCWKKRSAFVRTDASISGHRCDSRCRMASCAHSLFG
jgi:hypothetical protein